MSEVFIAPGAATSKTPHGVHAGCEYVGLTDVAGGSRSGGGPLPGIRLMVRRRATRRVANDEGGSGRVARLEGQRMDERDAAGFTLVVREILSGPRQLTEAVPTQA